MTHERKSFGRLKIILVLSMKALRPRSASMIVPMVGFAMVAGMLIAVLDLSAGVSRLWQRTGATDVALVLGKGAFAELNSHVSQEAVARLAQAPGLARLQNPVSPELLVTVGLSRASDGQAVDIRVRGFAIPPVDGQHGYALLGGRLFKPGLDEIVVGKDLQAKLSGAGIGGKVRIGTHAFTIVGVFGAGDGIHESEIWGDSNQIGSAMSIPGQVTDVYVKLTSPEDYGRFVVFVGNMPGMNVDVFRETDFFHRQAAQFQKVILLPGSAIIFLMAVAAILASANTMNSSIQERLSDITTLRAIGFDASAVMTALTLEAAIMGLLGGAAGAVAASALLRSASVLTSNGTSAMAFTMDASPQSIGLAVALSIAFGFAGGIWPALRTSRMPVAETLRSA